MSFLKDFLRGSLPSQTSSSQTAPEKSTPKTGTTSGGSASSCPPLPPPLAPAAKPPPLPATSITLEKGNFAPPALVTTIDDLVKACEEGRLEDVSSALDSGLDINARSRYGWTPLSAAAIKRQLDVAQLVLSRGAQVDGTDGSGQTALFGAARFGSFDIAVLLIEAGADVNARDHDGHVPLNSALTSRKSEVHMRIIELLLSRGARTDAMDKAGWAPLHQAAKNNNVNGAKLLLQYGADVNAETENRRTPLYLHQEEERGDEGREMQNLLLEAGGKAPGFDAADWHLKGQEHCSDGDFEQAIQCFKRALEHEPLDDILPDIWYNMGCALDEEQCLVEAIDCYDKAIKLQPRAADALNRKGVALGKLGDLDTQLLSFREAVAADSKNTKALHNLGAALHNRGEMREALRCYDKILAIEPKNAKAWMEKGIILAKLGVEAKALDCHDRACELDPSLEIPLADPREQAIEDFYKRVVRPRRTPPS